MNIIPKYINIFCILLISFCINNQSLAKSSKYGMFSDEKDDKVVSQIYDPFEKLNRKIYKFNKLIDKVTAKPIATSYRKATPKPVRISIKNFLQNILQPVVIVSSILRGEFVNAGKAFSSFAINSTIGIAGLFKPTENNFGITYAKKEDLGRVFAKYKIPKGPYLMLPFLGPSNPRDLAGLTITSLIYPVKLVEKSKYQIYSGTYLLDVRERLLDPWEQIERGSLDPYSFIRSAYIQNRDR